jgi:hypothetical protein
VSVGRRTSPHTGVDAVDDVDGGLPVEDRDRFAVACPTMRIAA